MSDFGREDRVKGFIKLTQTHNDRPVWVDMGKIVYFSPTDQGTALAFSAQENDWIMVKEGVDHILWQIALHHKW
jgi:hypothetical protein